MKVPETRTEGALAPSTDTALCLIPPQQLWHRVDGLRCLHERAYGKWPPHVSLIYPFVKKECLQNAMDTLGRLDLNPLTGDILPIYLDEADVFSHKHHNTLYIRPRGEDGETLQRLHRRLMGALGRECKETFHPHMTIAQSDDLLSDSHRFLMEKVRLLTPFRWDAGQLAVLVRDCERPGTPPGLREMRYWGSVSLGPGPPVRLHMPASFYGPEDDEFSAKPTPQTSYHFQYPSNSWEPLRHAELPNLPHYNPDRLIVASYNVLAEFKWPPSFERHSRILANILSDRAAADIIVLEEVTDQLLSSLLADQNVCSRYPYSTHGPPGQPDAGPLPSLLNIIVMSKFPIQWSRFPFRRKHKGAVVATFPSVKNCVSPETTSLPLVLAACHLSHGLVDAAVVAKKTEMRILLAHLSAEFQDHPWIIAGDFNLPTSSYSLDMARKRQDISHQSYHYIRGFDTMLSDMDLQDAWVASRVVSGDSSNEILGQHLLSEFYEGEQGATFNPLTNEIAAKMAGGGINNRPQRYDRILVNSHLHLRPCRFNMFGIPSTGSREDPGRAAASDHWGIRCLLERPDLQMLDTSGAVQGAAPQLSRAPASLGGLEEIKKSLNFRGCLPNDEDKCNRIQAVKLLERALQCQGHGELNTDFRSGARLILITVGSYALGVWTPSSDIDCLCVGEISAKTFFSLAKSRLRKYSSEGIAILRKVRAKSGTMLELDVRGIRVDLQYCCAKSILEQFPDVMKRPSSDPVFSLPASTLSKLKPLRDLFYLQRSIPDMAQYRAAHLLLKEWAKDRGLYGARFGLLGSVHLSVMLVPICKAFAYSSGSVTVGDVLVSFFHHYARFDWTQHAVFDPFFHGRLKYHRSFREPLCLLGWHTPSLNTAANASVPTVNTLTTELRRAESLLSQESMTWGQFLDPGPVGIDGGQSLSWGAMDFLQSHKSFVRIDMHYWGSSSTVGVKFAGWLESRCVMLLVDLDRKAPTLAARMWPQPFTEEPTTIDLYYGYEYQRCYLIGLNWKGNSGELMGEGAAKIAKGAVESVLRQFETRMRGDEKYFDANCCWLSTEVVQRNEVESLKSDCRHLGGGNGEHGVSEDESGSEDEDQEEDEDEAGDQRCHARTKVGKVVSQRYQSSENTPAPGKFRTATDVMNRLRWDPSMDSSDYIIGYVDRFTGTQEKRLELWKTEQTDEEFIPQHRILYFRRCSDGVIVWERRKRVDDVFGSGIPKCDNGV